MNKPELNHSTPCFGRLFAQAVAMLFIGFIFLAGMEGVVRFAGWGKDDPDSSVLYYQQIQYPLFKPVELANGVKVFKATDARLGSQQFAVEKDPLTYRIFVFGGSAANGLGFSPNVRFSHYLENFLHEIYPQVKTEVINCGIIGFSSRQERMLVENVSQNYSPDLLVVYSGNNEFLELHARMFMDKKLNARVLQMQDTLNKSQFYRALRAGIQRLQQRTRAGGEAGEDKFAKFAFSESELIDAVKITPAEYDFVLKKYRENLQGILKENGKTPLLLLTVASNLHWNDPDDLQVNWLEDYLRKHPVVQEKNLDIRDRQAQLSSALSLLQEEAKQTTDQFNDHADAIHYRLGKVYEELGDPGRARVEFERARDLDKRSRRALGTFNQSIMDLAAQETPQGNWHVLDMEAELSQRAPRGIIGYETFYDYVHFTPLGAQQTAEVIAKRIVRDRLLETQLSHALESQAFDYAAFMENYAAAIAKRSLDYPQADQWLGFNFDKGEIASVNLFKYREGVASLKNMVELGRKDPWIYTFLGNAYFHNLDAESLAFQNYREALRLTASGDEELRSAVLWNMGLLYERQGKSEEAQQYMGLAKTLKQHKTAAERVALDKILRVQ